MQVRIASPEKILFSGEANDVVLQGFKGQLNILNGHANFVTTLKAGEVRIRQQSGRDEKVFDVQDGLVKVHENQLTLLTSQAALKD